MIDLLLVVLYYFSLFMMASGIWMVINTVLSNDKSMGMGMIIGVVSILIGVLFFTISNMSKSENEIQSKSVSSHPVPTLIPVSTP